jgi:hypothetical protein
MKKITFFLVLVCLGKALQAQYVYTIKADSVKITNTCDTAELIIENHTQSVPGFLFNKGRGRTEFRRGLTDLSNNVYLIGADTFDVNKILDGSYFKQGGNSFGTNALLGTRDNYPLTFLQNAVEKGRIGTTGNWLFNTTEDKGYLAQFNGDVYTSGTINTEANVKIVLHGGTYGDMNINIGKDNYTSGPVAVALGNTLSVSSPGGILGFGAGWGNSVNGGIGIFGNTDKGIALGMGSYAHKSSIAMGYESVSIGENQFVCGGPDHHEPNANWSNAMYEVYFGSGIQRNNVEGPGLSYSINGSGAYGNNNPGGNISITGGKGTGAGTPGSIIFATAQPTSSGSTLQSLTERARFDANGNLGIGNTTPAAMLHVSGTGRFDNTINTSGHRSAIRNISGNSTIVDTDEYVFVNAASGSVTVTLPSATGRDGQTYTIKRIDESSNTVTIANASSQLIDGQSSYSLDRQWSLVTIVANGNTWMIVAKN